MTELERLAVIYKAAHDRFWDSSREERDQWRDDDGPDNPNGNPFDAMRHAEFLLLDYITGEWNPTELSTRSNG